MLLANAGAAPESGRQLLEGFASQVVSEREGRMRMHRKHRRGSSAKLRHLVTGAVVAAALVAVTLTSGPARALTQAAPKNTTEPRISGSATAGSTLTTTSGDWTGSSPINYAYQWVRCPTSGGKSDGSDCASISGATTSAYVVGSGDVGKRLRVRVTASNADGSATAASNPTGVVASGGSGRPRNTKLPSISGNASPASTLHGDPGTWTGTQPITFTFQWLRCDASGNNCLALNGQLDDSYTLRDGDIGHTLRIRVFAMNAAGKRNALSGATAVVSGGSGLPPGAIKLPNGEVSIPATSVPASERLVVDRVDFSPSPVRSRSTPIAINIKVKDTRGYDVRDVLVFVRSTPLVTSTPSEQRTADDGTVTYTVQPGANFPIRNGYSVQFFVKAHRQGDNPLAGVAGYRLVQVATAP
jgi:hypothetical protein